MSEDIKDAGGNDAPTRFSLSRWSERKRAAARGEAIADSPLVPPASVAPPATAGSATAQASPIGVDSPLPAVETLTFDSDFTVFMAGHVDESVKRAALRTLLRDPRFNVMDGLDTYIDDYSIADPISPEILAQLRHSIDVLNPVFPADEPATPVAGEQAATDLSPPESQSAPQSIGEAAPSAGAQVVASITVPATEDTAVPSAVTDSAGKT